jgi:hypothetical protein
MHQQLGGSPDDTASNLRAILTALADINIVGIAPSFDPPHIRVLVEDEIFDTAYDRMVEAGLKPTVHSAVTAALKNNPTALKTAMDKLERKGYVVDAILVLPGNPKDAQNEPILDQVLVSFGVRPSVIVDWDDTRSAALGADISDQ